jgi:hypothetical protein
MTTPDPWVTSRVTVESWLALYRPQTATVYRATYEKFREALGRDLSKLTQEGVRAWVTSMPGAPATRDRETATIASLLSYCFKVGALREDLGAVLPRPPRPHRAKNPTHDPATIRKVIEAASSEYARAALQLFLSHRVPISAIAALTFEDITPEGLRCGSKLYPIEPDLRSALQGLRTEPEPSFACTGKPLSVFRNASGWPLGARDLRRLVSKAAQAAGVDPSVVKLKQPPLVQRRSYVFKDPQEGPYGIVYGLYHPGTGVLHYVGVTKRTIQARLAGHLCPDNLKKRKRASQWLRGLVAEGLTPQARVLATAATRDELYQLERQFISQARHDGMPLVNCEKRGVRRTLAQQTRRQERQEEDRKLDLT